MCEKTKQSQTENWIENVFFFRHIFGWIRKNYDYHKNWKMCTHHRLSDLSIDPIIWGSLTLYTKFCLFVCLCVVKTFELTNWQRQNTRQSLCLYNIYKQHTQTYVYLQLGITMIEISKSFISLFVFVSVLCRLCVQCTLYCTHMTLYTVISL